MRSDIAVPRACGGEYSATPDSVSVEAMPSPSPIAIAATYITGSDGTASSANAPAANSELPSVSGMRPSA